MLELSWRPEIADWRARLKALPSDPSQAWDEGVRLAKGRIDFLATTLLDSAVHRALAGQFLPVAGKAVRLALLGSCTMAHLHPALRVDAELQSIQGRISECWRLAHTAFGCRIIHQTVLPVHLPLLGNNEHRLPGSRSHLVARLNQSLRTMADAQGVDLLAIDDRVQQDGIKAWTTRSGAAWSAMTALTAWCSGKAARSPRPMSGFRTTFAKRPDAASFSRCVQRMTRA